VKTTTVVASCWVIALSLAGIEASAQNQAGGAAPMATVAQGTTGGIDLAAPDVGGAETSATGQAKPNPTELSNSDVAEGWKH